MTKKMKLELIAAKSRKLTGWLKKKDASASVDVVDMEWMDVPEGQDPVTIERLEEAKKKKELWRRKNMAKEIILELVRRVEAESGARWVLNKVVEMAWWTTRCGQAWSVLENDKQLQKEIMRRIMKQEEEEILKKKEYMKSKRLERKRIAEEVWRKKRLLCQMESEKMEIDSEDGTNVLEEAMAFLSIISVEDMDMDTPVMEDYGWNELEDAEHWILDHLQLLYGVEMDVDGQDSAVGFSIGEEIVAHQELDDFLLEYRVGVKADDDQRNESDEEIIKLNEAKFRTENDDNEFEDESGSIMPKIDKVRVTGVNVDLTNKDNYYGMGTWYLDRWRPSHKLAFEYEILSGLNNGCGNGNDSNLTPQGKNK